MVGGPPSHSAIKREVGAGAQDMRFTLAAKRPTDIPKTLTDLRGGAASDGKTATGRRRLCTVATVTAPSPSGFTVPLSINPMASSSSTKAVDDLHLLNPYLSLTLSVNPVLVRVLGFTLHQMSVGVLDL